MRKLLVTALMLAGLPVASFAVSGTATLVNSTGLAFSTATPQNLQNFAATGGSASKLSAQVTFSSATIAAQSFIGGQTSTATITVVSTQSLVQANATDSIIVPSTTAILGSPATGYITVLSANGLAGSTAAFTTTLTTFANILASSPSITLNGYLTYTWAGNWTSTDTMSHAADTLVNAINAGGSFTAAKAFVGASTTVVIMSISKGSSLNGTPVTSSSATLVSSGTFSGGRDPVTITINNGLQDFKYTYGANWPSSGTTTTTNANSLAGAINGQGGIVSANGAAVVAATSTLVGTFANSWTLKTSSAALVSVSSPVFAGGLDPALRNAYFTIGGAQYKNGYGWTDASGTSSGTVHSIAVFLNSVSTNIVVIDGGLGNVSAVESGQNVLLTAGIPGSAGNALTLAGTGFTFGSALFTGGQDNASFNIGGINFQYPTNWNLGVSSTVTTTALSIAASINANAVTGAVIVATNSAGVVAATGTVNGSGTNYTLTSSTVSLAVKGFTGGLDTAYSSNSATIALPSHNFTLALPVLYSTSSAKAITGLVNQTTYYVIVVDANNIKLAASSANALANTAIVLGSTDTTAAKNTYTLTPGPWIQGPAAALWQVSNDGVNWATYSTTAQNVAVSSNTFLATTPATTQVQDFGQIDYNFIRYNITGPTQGGIVLKVVLTAKD